MSSESNARRIYEAHIERDAMTRLASRVNVGNLPFSQDELMTLVKRAREYYKAHRSPERRARACRFKMHLSKIYGDEPVTSVWHALESINNDIGFEEK